MIRDDGAFGIFGLEKIAGAVKQAAGFVTSKVGGEVQHLTSLNLKQIVTGLPGDLVQLNPISLTAQTGILGSRLQTAATKFTSWTEHNPGTVIAVTGAAVATAVSAGALAPTLGAAVAPALGVTGVAEGLTAKLTQQAPQAAPAQQIIASPVTPRVGAPAGTAVVAPKASLGAIAAAGGAGFLAGGPVGAAIGAAVGYFATKPKAGA